MKKFLFILVTAMLFLVGCEKSKPNLAIASLNVEHSIALDRQQMFVNHSDNYRWYETCIMLNDFLDEENDGSIEEVVNVFQAIYTQDSCFDTMVFKFQHFADGTYNTDSIHGFWIEDSPLNEEAIKLTFKDAFDKLMATNCPKPHSRYCTLRKEVGPKDCNPQYIFGNIHKQVYVDAVTGDVSEVSPAFGFAKPLGEWP